MHLEIAGEWQNVFLLDEDTVHAERCADGDPVWVVADKRRLAEEGGGEASR